MHLLACTYHKWSLEPLRIAYNYSTLVAEARPTILDRLVVLLTV